MWRSAVNPSSHAESATAEAGFCTVMVCSDDTVDVFMSAVLLLRVNGHCPRRFVDIIILILHDF